MKGIAYLFPEFSKFRGLLVRNFEDKIPCLLRASYLHVFDSLRLNKWGNIRIHLCFINNPFLILAPKIVWAFLKNFPKKLFSNCLVDGLLTSIVYIFKHSKRRHSVLQGHLEYAMHTFELTSPKVCISLRCHMQKKCFSLYSQWIV